MKVINTEYQSYPSPDGVNRCMLAVLTLGARGTEDDYAVYAGIVIDPYGLGEERKQRDIDFVCANGHKLSHRKAVSYFPFLKEEMLRE